MSSSVALVVLVGTGLVAFAGSLLVRRLFPGLRDVDTSPWLSTLSYVATAYGVVVGFTIIFLFGAFSDARQAVGNEATSIGTAFEESRLFPAQAQQIQHALICYSRAVPEYEWPAMRDGTSAPEVDAAYKNLILAPAGDQEAASGTFERAAATNLFAQLGDISTARETRLVAAETDLPPLLYGLLIGGGLFVVALIFMGTMSSAPRTQAVLVSLSAVFTMVMISIVIALSTPFASGSGRVSPKLIEQTTASMTAEAPDGRGAALLLPLTGRRCPAYR